MILVFKTCIFFPQLALFLETSWVLLFGKTSKFELGKTARLWNSHLQPLLNALLIFVLFLLLYSFNRSFRRNFCNFSHFVTFETLQSRLVFPSNLLVFENLSSLVFFFFDDDFVFEGESGKNHGNKSTNKRKKPKHPNSYPSGRVS